MPWREQNPWLLVSRLPGSPARVTVSVPRYRLHKLARLDRPVASRSIVLDQMSFSAPPCPYRSVFQNNPLCCQHISDLITLQQILRRARQLPSLHQGVNIQLQIGRVGRNNPRNLAPSVIHIQEIIHTFLLHGIFIQLFIQQLQQIK